MIDSAVTVVGLVGFLGLLAAARMNESIPYDVAALVWFAVFGAIKIGLPLLLEKQERRTNRRLRY